MGVPGKVLAQNSGSGTHSPSEHFAVESHSPQFPPQPSAPHVFPVQFSCA